VGKVAIVLYPYPHLPGGVGAKSTKKQKMFKFYPGNAGCPQLVKNKDDLEPERIK